MSKPKPKSVDECWMVEDESLNFLPILSATTFARAEALVKHLIFSDRHMQIVDSKYRIRKWRAETVCEWKHDNIDGYYTTACGEAFIFTDGTPKDNAEVSGASTASAGLPGYAPAHDGERK